MSDSSYVHLTLFLLWCPFWQKRNQPLCRLLSKHLNPLLLMVTFIFKTVLTIGSADNMDILMSSEITKFLLPLLLNVSLVTRQRSMKLLSELSQDEEVKDLITQLSGVKPIVQLAQSDDAESQESAIFALSCLCSRSNSLQLPILIACQRTC
jgi:hypothetical protein